MTEVHFIVSPAGSGRFDAHIDGRYQLTSPPPLIDTCRLLIAHIDPDTQIAMRHAGSDYDALWGRLGDLAGLRVTTAGDGRPILRRQDVAAASYSDLNVRGGPRTTLEADA